MLLERRISIRTIIIVNVIVKLKQNFLKRYDQQFVNFLKHGSKYATARFLVGAISFIAIPIYTRFHCLIRICHVWKFASGKKKK
jgi:hypothetical protein